jgi:hypothetical protein
MMPVTSSAVAVSTSAVKIADGMVVFGEYSRYYDPNIVAKLVYAQDGDFDGDTIIYVGGSSVTTSTGIKLSKTNNAVFQLHSGDDLYAICSTSGGSVRVVEVG